MTSEDSPRGGGGGFALLCCKRRWQVLSGLCVGLSLCYAQRTNLSVAAVAMAEDLKWSDGEKGAALSAFFWGYCVFMLPGGLFVRRHGGFLMFGLSVLVSTVLTAAIPAAAAMGVGWVYALRAVTGAVEACTFPAIYAVMQEWVPESERGASIGLVFGAEQLGSMLGYGATGVLVHRVSWQSSFYFFAALGAAASVFWFAFCSESPGRDRWITPQERDEILRGKGKAVAGYARGGIEDHDDMDRDAGGKARSASATAAAASSSSTSPWVHNGSMRHRGRGSGDDLASRNNNAISSSSSSSSSSGGGGNNPLGEALLGDRGEDGEGDVDNDSGGMVGSGIISIDADVRQEDPPSFPAAGDSGQPPPLPPPSQQQAAVPWRIIVFTWQCWPVYVQHFW